MSGHIQSTRSLFPYSLLAFFGLLEDFVELNCLLLRGYAEFPAKRIRGQYEEGLMGDSFDVFVPERKSMNFQIVLISILSGNCNSIVESKMSRILKVSASLQ